MSETKPEASRRDFLKLAGTAAPAAVAAVAVSGSEAEAAPAEGPQKGLADTAHTRAYYASARF
ncbi:twin-arginine translocation signal domain-containing protein [Litorisediminicola beolgyonensis]|uniref:Twin-arginine translocation signal domain-containing protein n=1 Tax=Litorisediminicola beolgyonensis TaxID=1173614 RepID=A0ABW3ZJS9_9RHOB